MLLDGLHEIQEHRAAVLSSGINYMLLSSSKTEMGHAFTHAPHGDLTVLLLGHVLESNVKMKHSETVSKLTAEMYT